MSLMEYRVRSRVSEEEIEAKVGLVLTDDDYNLAVTRDCRILKPDGRVLLVYRRGVIPEELRASTWPIVSQLSRASITANRGLAAGSK